MKKTPYTLQDIENGLETLITSTPVLRSNLDAVIHLADSEMAHSKPILTEAQLKAVELVWKQEMSLTEAGEILGITKQGVRFNLQLLSVKLKRVVDEWAEREYNDED